MLADEALEEREHLARHPPHLLLAGQIGGVPHLGEGHAAQPSALAEQDHRDHWRIGTYGDVDHAEWYRRRCAEEGNRCAVADEVAVDGDGHVDATLEAAE